MLQQEEFDAFEPVDTFLSDENESALQVIADFEYPLKRNESDVHSLFNMDHLQPDDGDKIPKVTKRVVKHARFALSDTGVVVEEDSFVSLREQKQMDYDVNFNIIKPCQGGGRMPSMPSLRLEMNEKDYHEPIRDRDKNWFLQSQRGVIERKGLQFVSPKFDLDLGAYENINAKSPLFWSSGFQAMIREKIMMRKAAIISDTNCIVTVYGLGIDGRVVANGGSGSKLVIIEAYSIWNSTKYYQFLNSMRLRILLNKTPDLLKPGKKKELLSTLIQLLYFKYTITIPTAHEHLAAELQDHLQHSAEDHKHAAELHATEEAESAGEAPAGTIDNDEVDAFSQTVELPEGFVADVENTSNKECPEVHDGILESNTDLVLSTVESTEALMQLPLNEEKVDSEAHEATENVTVEMDDQPKEERPPVEHEDESRSVAGSAKGSVHSRQSKQSKAPSARSNHSNPHHPHHSQTITHLDLPDMPDGYPKTIEEMLRVPPVPPESKDMPPPIITQDLCISDTKLENGPKLRKRLVEINRRLAAAREAEELRIWNATPKIRRNLMFIRGMKLNQKLFIVRCYFSDIRPTVLTVKAMSSVECVTLTTFVGLNKIKAMLELTSKVSQWSKDDIKLHVKHCLPQIHLDRPTREFNPRSKKSKFETENNCNLSLGGDCGPEAVLKDFLTAGQLMSTLTARKRPLLSGRFCDPFTPEWLSSQPRAAGDPDCIVPTPVPAALTREDMDEWDGLRLPPESREELTPVELALCMLDLLLEDAFTVIDQTTDTIEKPQESVDFSNLNGDSNSQKMIQKQPTNEVPIMSNTIMAVPSSRPSYVPPAELVRPDTSSAVEESDKSRLITHPGWTSLGKTGSTRSLSLHLHGPLKPLRCVRPGVRLTSQSMKLGGVYVIFSLHMVNALFRGQGQPWPVKPPPPPPPAEEQEVGGAAERIESDEVNVVIVNTGDDGSSLANESADGTELAAGVIPQPEVSRPGTAASEVSESTANHSAANTDTTGSDNEDEDSDEEEEEEEVDWEDQMAEVYDSYCQGLKIELDIYIPHASVFAGVALDPHTTYRMVLSKADLYHYVEDRQLLSSALLSLYKDFYHSATSEAVARAEEAWAFIGREIVSQAYWRVREDGSSPGRSSLLPPTPAEVLQEVLCRDFTVMPLVVNSFQSFLLPMDNLNKSQSNDDEETKHVKKPPSRGVVIEPHKGRTVALTLSTITLNKFMFVTSAAEAREKRVMLQVYFWQKDEACGVACIDKEMNCVYLTQPASEELQSSQLRTFRMMEPFERSANIQTYLMSELQYSENDSGIGKVALVESALTMDVADE